jgi:hypothetical protein
MDQSAQENYHHQISFHPEPQPRYELSSPQSDQDTPEPLPPNNPQQLN